jgi:hypothetical protein
MGVDLDKWIEKVKRCEYLAEDELKSLCEYVSLCNSCCTTCSQPGGKQGSAHGHHAHAGQRNLGGRVKRAASTWTRDSECAAELIKQQIDSHATQRQPQ